MKYTIKQLQVFEAVANRNNVSQAAQVLGLSQSAASMALSQLESQLGHPLFERQGKRLALNPWGEWLLPRAQQLLADAAAIEMGLKNKHVLSGTLKFGASQTIAEQLVPDLIAGLDSDFPQLRIELDVHNSGRIIEGVLDYHYQVGVVESRCDDNRLAQLPWCQDNLVIIAAPHHPYASLKQVSLGQLEQARWVLRERGAGTRSIFDAAVHGRVAHIDVWREYSHVPALLALVSRGNYLSCLPYRTVKQFEAAGKICCLPVPELDMQRTFTFIWRKDLNDSPLRDALLKAAQRMARYLD